MRLAVRLALLVHLFLTGSGVTAFVHEMAHVRDERAAMGDDRSAGQGDASAQKSLKHDARDASDRPPADDREHCPVHLQLFLTGTPLVVHVPPVVLIDAAVEACVIHVASLDDVRIPLRADARDPPLA